MCSTVSTWVQPGCEHTSESSRLSRGAICILLTRPIMSLYCSPPDLVYLLRTGSHSR